MGVQASRKTEVDRLTERFLTLEDGPGRKRLVAQYPLAAWTEIVQGLAERVWQEVRVDTRKAEQSAQAAVDVAEAIGDPAALGMSLRAKANALYALDHHAAAIQLHQEAVGLFEKAGNDAE